MAKLLAWTLESCVSVYPFNCQGQFQAWHWVKWWQWVNTKARYHIPQNSKTKPRMLARLWSLDCCGKSTHENQDGGVVHNMMSNQQSLLTWQFQYNEVVRVHKTLCFSCATFQDYSPVHENNTTNWYKLCFSKGCPKLSPQQMTVIQNSCYQYISLCWLVNMNPYHGITVTVVPI